MLDRQTPGVSEFARSEFWRSSKTRCQSNRSAGRPIWTRSHSECVRAARYMDAPGQQPRTGCPIQFFSSRPYFRAKNYRVSVNSLERGLRPTVCCHYAGASGSARYRVTRNMTSSPTPRTRSILCRAPHKKVISCSRMLELLFELIILDRRTTGMSACRPQ